VNKISIAGVVQYIPSGISMVEVSEQIEQDISALKEAVAAIAQEVYSLYANYLAALGQAVQQQLILASFHLCTQAYPEAFLSLPLQQKQELQQALQYLGQEAQQQIQTFSLLLPVAGGDANDPDRLVEAIARLESAILEELQQISQVANRTLEEFNILSAPAVEIALEVAAKAEALGGAVGGPPNLLTAIMEEAGSLPEGSLLMSVESLDQIANPDKQQESTATEIVAIYLRLAEIEFVDSTVMAWRNQLRKLSTRLTGVQRELAKKQRQRMVAEAETVWRASWSNGYES